MSMDVAERDFRSLPIEEMEAIVYRFNKRINAAQQTAPSTKDWVKQAIHRRGPGRSPVRLKRLSLDIIIRYGDALADLFCEYPDDVIQINPYDWAIGYQAPDRKDRINPIEVMMRDAQWADEWGTRWGHAFGGVGATQLAYPLEDWADLDSYLADKIPCARAPGRLDAASELIKIHSTKYCYGTIVLGLFERLHSLRSMQDIMMDFYSHENEVRRLMDALCDNLLELIRYWAEVGADGLFIGDDWGTQTGLMISPSMWRDIFKPYYKIIFEEVHRCGMDVIFHSCGNIVELIADLIDAGVDVLDPVQPGAMDIKAVAREFGGHISFSGGIDLQHLLCNGSPQEVKDAVCDVIDTLGRPFGGGFLVGPANVMSPDIPLKNLTAMFEAANSQ